MTNIEIIREGGQALAYFVPGSWFPQETQFLTPADLGQQMGMIVCAANHQIQPHMHLPVTRQVSGTTECIVVRRGSCDIDIYDSSRKLVASRHLVAGDIALLIAGGHGFRMCEDTVLFEVKQGPFVGTADKERF